MSDQTTTTIITDPTPRPIEQEASGPIVEPPAQAESSAVATITKAAPMGGLHTPRGWFKVRREDIAKIVGSAEGTAPSTVAVWITLCDLDNEHGGKHTFTTSVGIIRKLSGVSRATAFLAFNILEQLGMLERIQNRMDCSKKALDFSTYTLPTLSDKQTTPPSDKRTTPSLRKFRKSRTDLKEGRSDAPQKAHSPSSTIKKEAPSNPAPPQRLTAGGAGAGASEPDPNPKSRHQIGGAW